jgi:hypothetical protein
VLVAASLVLLAIGAAALAAIGVEVRLGPARREIRTTNSLLELPRGAHGFAVFARGKLWLATRAGVQVQGLGVSAVSLSPRARYVAVGLGRQLVAMAPNGRHAWARSARGRVLAASWSPDGLKIAYVVQRASERSAHRNELHLIEGDGDHDRVLDVGVSLVAPSWRADSLAVAYVSTGGRTIVYDLGHLSRQLLLTRCASPGPVRALAFAPAGSKLAALTQTGVLLSTRNRRRAECRLLPDVPALTGIAWLDRQTFVTSEPVAASVRASGQLRRWVTDGRGRLLSGGTVCGPAGIVAIAAAPSGARVALAIRNRPATLDVREVQPGSSWGSCPPLPESQRLLVLRRAGSAELFWR